MASQKAIAIKRQAQLDRIEANQEKIIALLDGMKASKPETKSTAKSPKAK